MHAKPSTVTKTLRTFLCGGVLLATLAATLPAAWAVPDPTWTTYEAFALDKDYAKVEGGDTVYYSGYGPTEDQDGDGLTNREEFDGWSATVNGVVEYYTWSRDIYNGIVAPDIWVADGPDIEEVDSDCDAMSDLYESDQPGYAVLNPWDEDTDGDSLTDPVEVYAGLNPKDDGQVRVGGVPVPNHFTLQYPGLDPDGDGLPTSSELSSAETAVADICATVASPFPSATLDGTSWTDPLDCDTDSDWLLDSFEVAFSFLDAVTATDRHGDSDLDGLTNFREQSIHPLLANYWPLAYGTPYPFSGLSLSAERFNVSNIGTRYGTGTRCLVAPGYLLTAGFDGAGDVEEYYDAADMQQGTGPGPLTWGLAPADYWTDPGQTSTAWDSDGDDLPDGWEVEHGLNPLDGVGVINGKLGDPDGDLLVNLQEYFGADGYRVDYRTGTGDETIPWITRSQNQGAANTAPFGFDETIFEAAAVPPQPTFSTVYPVDLYPGFFGPAAPTVPVPGTPSMPPITDTADLFNLYGEDATGTDLGGFDSAVNVALPADGAGAFQPFQVDGLYYEDIIADGRYTPYLDALWYNDPTLGLGENYDSVGGSVLLSVVVPTADPVPGSSLLDNWPILLPMRGWDSDQDGLPDNVEIRMAVSSGKMRTSPVNSHSPLVPRSARILTGVGLANLTGASASYFARDFTAEMWVRIGSGTPSGILAQGLTSSGFVAFELGLDTGVPYIAFESIGGTHRHEVSAARAISAGQWINLAGTFDHADNALTLYLNGALEQSEEVGEETAAFDPDERTGTLVLAQGADFAAAADGLWVDEIRIWKVARTASEITDNYRRMILSVQPGPVDPYGNQEANGLVAYYSFEDGGDTAESLFNSAGCSLDGYAYPHDTNVLNFPSATYIYPEAVFALPSEALGGDFEFDAGIVGPVDGGLDNQRGEWDSDGDTLPDAWELVHEFNPYAMLTPLHAQADLYDTTWTDLANPGVTGVTSDAEGDYDGDGLTNVQEYWANTNPRKADTDQDGIRDSEEDFDKDGLSNRLESQLGSRPDLQDTDDDGETDSMEQADGTSPIDSTSPAKDLALYLDGYTGSYLDIYDQSKLWLSSWTLEAKVLPSDVNALADGEGATIVRRTVQDTDDNKMAANFELRVVRVDDGGNSYMTPEVRYTYVDNDGDGQSVAVRGAPQGTNTAHRLPVADAANDPYPTEGLAQIVGTYDGTTGQLNLYMDGVLISNETFSAESRPPQSGKGARSFVRIGENLAGFVDDIRIWSDVRTKVEIAENMDSIDSASSNLVALYTMDDGGFPALLTKASVLQILLTPPVGPSFGDRYLIDGVGTGDWAGQDDAIAEFSGSIWTFTEAEEGMRVLDESTGNVMLYTGGSWGVLAGDPEIVRGVHYPADPGAALKLEGVSWYAAPDIVTIESGVEYSTTAPANLFCEGVMVNGAAVVNGLHWWASRNAYYLWDGAQWLEWGPSLHNLSPARLKADGNYATFAALQAVPGDRVVGERFVVSDPLDPAIYTALATDGTNPDNWASEPLNAGDRILLPDNTVRIWTGATLETLADGSTFGGDLYILVRNEGVSYKSDGTVWTRWSIMPTLEDSTVDRDWENQWRSAARMSGYGSLRQLAGVVRSLRDTDGDGLPDAWEVANNLDPCDSGVVDATNVCTGAIITNTLNGASGDPDEDGLNNLYEYLLEYDPWDEDTDGDGITDLDEDYDLDGLSNGQEINVYGTDPADVDTDDDGEQDNVEIMQNTSALYSRSPLVGRSMVMNGVPVTIPEPREVVDGETQPQRFQDLDYWYLAAMVRPDAGQTGSIIRRTVTGGGIHFEMGLNNNIPYVQFNDPQGALHTASSSVALPTDRFSALIAEWSPSNHILRLRVDDCVVGAANVASSFVKGPGETVVGDGISGHIDDVYIGPDLLGGATASPDYVLMIDVSGSMGVENRMEQAREAAITAIEALPRGSSMALISFDSEVQRVQGFTTDKDVLKTFVDALVPLGLTSYSAPVSEMISLISNRASPGGYVGMLISDGLPNSGVPTDADLAQAVSLGAVINTVGFGSSILAGSTFELERIAQQTGGTFYAAPSGQELEEILTGILAEEESLNSCFYPFDDNGQHAEDYKALLDWDYAMDGVTFDDVVFSTAITPFNYAFVDFDDELPEWWLEWFLKDSDATTTTNDPDADGLTNLNEWRITFMSEKTGLPALSPILPDSDGDGTDDGDEDHDSDTLISKDEQANHVSRVDRLDTDDDELDDNQELAAAMDPSYSMIPYVARAMRFGAAGGDGEVQVEDRVRGLDTEHLSAEDWTVECFVQPEAVPPAGVDQPLIQRTLRCSGLINYELGIRNNGSGQIVPYARFNHFNDANIAEITTDVTLPVGAWGHLAGRLSDGMLSLFIDGQIVRSMITDYDPAQGLGDATFGGNGFTGRLKDARIWKIGRRDVDIQDFSRRSLLFGAAAADSGLLRVYGDEGHLREVAAPGTQRDQLRNWTLECWVRTVDTEGTILSRVNTGNVVEETDDFNYFIGVDQDGRLVGKFAIQYREVTITTNGTTQVGELNFNTTANTLVSALPVNDGEWHHVAYTRDDQDAVLYIDGELSAIQSGFLLPGGLAATLQDQDMRILDGPVEIGRNLTGDIDEVRIWSRALSPTEIDSVMSQNLYGNEDGLVTYFSFDFQRGVHAEDRASVRNPDSEYGTYIPSAQLVRTTDQAPIENFFPLRVYAFTSLLGYYPADDGGDTMENLIYQNNWEYAGILTGDAAFEVLSMTNKPFLDDSDGDGMPDSWETQYGLDPNSDRDSHGAYGDIDHDGLNNLAEFLAGTDPTNWDTDGDGLSDYNSSAGGVTYGEYYMDGDQIPDIWELMYGDVMSPLVNDAHDDPDGDGWSNLSEYLGTGIALNYTTNTTGEGTNEVTTVEITESTVTPTRPNSAMSYPVPDVHFTFLGDPQMVLSSEYTLGQDDMLVPSAPALIVWAYSDPAMRRPDAKTIIPFNGEFANGLTATIDRWVTGHLRQGATTFMAFIDANADGKWNEGEWLGYSEHNTENVQWGSLNVRIGLTDKPAGYVRFSWENDMTLIATALSQVNGTTYIVSMKALGEAGQPVIYSATRHLESMSRTFVTEMDLKLAGVDPLYGAYQWGVGTADGAIFATGTNSITYSSNVVAMLPAINFPDSTTLVHAHNKLRLDVPRHAAEMSIRILRGSTTVWVTTSAVPDGVLFDDIYGRGEAEFKMPLAGWGSFTNGNYTLQVQALNPRVSSSVVSSSFSVNLQEAPVGAGTIKGTMHYFGSASGNWVVEAFTGAGFDQTSVARTRAAADGSYSLMGLRTGTYSVRSYVDVNGNGQLDPSEPWGFLKSQASGGDILTKQGSAREKGSSSSQLPYAVEYSVKTVDLSAQGLARNQNLIAYDSMAYQLIDVDSDFDGMPDNVELALGTSPARWDSDFDNLSDYDEVRVLGTDPLNPDTDGDGMDDGWENANGFNPLSASDASGDVDGDGLPNDEEFSNQTDPRDADTDGDGMNDGYEVANHLNPLVDDSEDDEDGDGVPNGQELLDNTDPNLSDTDGDGLSDGEEKIQHTNPLVTDTDGDGYSDGDEVDAGTYPLYASDFPTGKRAQTQILSITTSGTDATVVYTATGLTGVPVILWFQQNDTPAYDGNWFNTGVERTITTEGTYTNTIPDANTNGILNIRIRCR